MRTKGPAKVYAQPVRFLSRNERNLNMAYDNAVPVQNESLNKEMLVSELFSKYGQKVTRICFSYTKDWEDAREMSQEAFIKAYRGLDGFEGRSQHLTWITRIAINQCLTFLAARGRERLGKLNFLHERENAESESGWQLESYRVAVGRLMQDTDSVTRQVLSLVMHQGLSHSQIATTLGVSRVAITRRITRFKRMALGRISRPG
jgi:RNA polymerase sigma-70 factor (ECF subfamily)